MIRKTVILFIYAVSFLWTNYAYPTELFGMGAHPVPREEPKEETPELTLENVRKELEKQGVKHVDIVLRQAIVETGWFKCKHCSLKSNNIFGFSFNGKDYLEFENWVESVAYYKQWQDKLYEGGDYYQFLDDIGYAVKGTYVAYLKQIKV